MEATATAAGSSAAVEVTPLPADEILADAVVGMSVESQQQGMDVGETLPADHTAAGPVAEIEPFDMWSHKPVGGEGR